MAPGHLLDVSGCRVQEPPQLAPLSVLDYASTLYTLPLTGDLLRVHAVTTDSSENPLCNLTCTSEVHVTSKQPTVTILGVCGAIIPPFQCISQGIITIASWMEIPETIGSDVRGCAKEVKNLRDKNVSL